MDEATAAYIEAVKAGRLAALVTVLAGPGAGAKLCVLPSGATVGALGNDALHAAAFAAAHDALAAQAPARVAVGDFDLFVDVNAPPRRLIVVGAVHTAIPLVAFANALGFATIVLDNRTAFATPERFAHASRLIVRWPADALPDLALDEGCYLVFLTHDAKIDNPALQIALASPARYVGALGSRRTHTRRVEDLRALGVPDAQIARIRAPIGLDIGASTPEEIALAVMAEVVAVKNAKGRRD
jgi:xanthine dehydrogenase accessory factor